MICDSPNAATASVTRDGSPEIPYNLVSISRQLAMPTTKSAKKRLRQSDVRRTRNRAGKSAVKTQIKKVREAVVAGNLEVAETAFRAAAKKLDNAAASKIIHKNSAGRHKARLSHLIKVAKDKAKSAS